MKGTLFLPVSTGPFNDYRDGAKTVEIRQRRGRWKLKNVPKGRRVLLRRGYSTPDELTGTVLKAVEASSWAELPVWAKFGASVEDPSRSEFFDAYEPLLAFEIGLDRHAFWWRAKEASA